MRMSPTDVSGSNRRSSSKKKKNKFRANNFRATRFWRTILRYRRNTMTRGNAECLRAVANRSKSTGRQRTDCVFN